MKKILLSISVLGLALATGCGSSTGGDDAGSSGPEFCKTDNDCMGDICNTVGGVCMHQCSATSDCAATENAACAATNAAGATIADKTVCQCSSTTCGGGGSYCNSVDLICETSCSADTDCTGFATARTCQSGACLPPEVDAGMNCVTNPTICTATQMCDATTMLCVAIATSCGTANTAGNCAADQYCDGTACQPAAACPALTGSSPATNANSPIIWGVAPTGSTRTDSMCNGNIVQIKGYYLNEGSGTVATGSDSGATYKVVSWLQPSGAYGGGASGNSYDNTVVIDSTSFTFELCSPSADVQPAVVLADSAGDISNAACIMY